LIVCIIKLPLLQIENLNDLELSKEQLEKVYWGIIKEVNKLRLQIATKYALSDIDHQGKTFNTNIAGV
jgi:hypothetical protein